MDKAVFKRGDDNTFYLFKDNFGTFFLLPSFTCLVLELIKEKESINIKDFLKLSRAGDVLTGILNEKT